MDFKLTIPELFYLHNLVQMESDKLVDFNTVVLTLQDKGYLDPYGEISNEG